MIQREFDAARLNAVVNHPAVHAWIAPPGFGDLDLSEAVADRRNVLLMTEGGGVMFFQHEPGVYDAHTQFTPEVRGKVAFAATRAAVRYMFTNTDCMEVLTKVPAHNLAADALARRVGCIMEYERPDMWPTPDGLQAMRYFALRYPDWIKVADGLIESAQAFRAGLCEQGVTLGPDDPVQLKRLGAAVEMMAGGQVGKAVQLYNRWARFADYPEIGVASTQPIVLDIHEALIQVEGSNFGVIQCPSH